MVFSNRWDEIRHTGRGGENVAVVTDDGTELWVEADGPAHAPVTMVFVHGFTLNLTNFREQRVHLAGSPFRRVFYDQRGFGKSGRGPRGHVSIRRLALDLACVLDSVNGPVVLVGHSMGSMVIEALAGIHPERFGTQIHGSVLIATTANGDGIGMYGTRPIVSRFGAAGLRAVHRIRPVVRLAGMTPFSLVAWLFHDVRSSSSARRAFASMVSGTRFDVMGDYLRAMLEFDELSSIVQMGWAPTVVIAGQADRVTPLAANRLVAQVIPGAELVVASGSGHMVPLERPDVVNGVLTDLMARVLLTQPPR